MISVHDKILLGTTFAGSLIGGLVGPQVLNPKTTSEYAVSSVMGVMGGMVGGLIIGATIPIVSPLIMLGCAIGYGVQAYDNFKKNNPSNEELIKNQLKIII